MGFDNVNKQLNIQKMDIKSEMKVDFEDYIKQPKVHNMNYRYYHGC